MQARPKSGCYVAPPDPALPEPQLDPHIEVRRSAAWDRVLHQLLLIINDPQGSTAVRLRTGTVRYERRKQLPAEVRERKLVHKLCPRCDEPKS